MSHLSDWIPVDGSNSLVHRTSFIYPGVEIGDDTIVEEFAILGKPHRSQRTDLDRLLQDGTQLYLNKTVIGLRCYIQAGSVIYQGVSLADDVICTDYVMVGPGSTIGTRSKLQYRAQIFHNVQIGPDCRIGGFCCNGSRIGKGSTVYGTLVHHYRQHGGDPSDLAPTVGNDVVVAFNSTVVGDIRIGDNSYIASGALVTKDVPPDSIVIGVDSVVHRSRWSGRLSSHV